MNTIVPLQEIAMETGAIDWLLDVMSCMSLWERGVAIGLFTFIVFYAFGPSLKATLGV